MTLKTWLAAFSGALSARQPAAVAALFAENGFWRDFVAFTWDIRTLEGRNDIRDMVDATPESAESTCWTALSEEAEGAEEGFITFETPLGRGRGYVRLQNGLCWTLLTTLDDLKGHEARSGRLRAQGAPVDPAQPLANWRDQLDAEFETLGTDAQPYVLIVGGGQGGLGLAARLRHLAVPALVVDRHPRAGDQWRSRYHSLSLHDPVWYDHMPYLPFPETWPVFTPKDKMGDWLEAYAKIMELHVWGSTECVGATWDDDVQSWRVELRRQGDTVVLRPKHLVLATGNAGKPNIPVFPGAGTFGGTQVHSSAHTGGAGFRDQKVAVVGSNNSAHDICADLVEHGADVTMIQRSPTHVSRATTLGELLLAPYYSEEAVASGMTTDKADLINASLPLRVLPEVYRPAYEEVARRDADFYARLEAAGFMHDFGEDGTGLPLLYLRRASGYYVDVGASDLVASGAIKLRSRVGVERIEPDGLILSDGSKVEADAIIYATGFGSMEQWAADLISPKVAATVGKVWGYGSGTAGDPGPWEGELRNMWKPTRQPGLWFHGGNLAQSRFYSRFLALQLKARYAGLPIKVYAPAPTEPALA
jgi:putative flavoprotein involved in K+ transport